MSRKILALFLSLVFVLTCVAPAGAELLDNYHKSDPIQNLPDFGQVSQNWCWAAAAANSLYWYAKHGYPEILDDPLKPGFDQDLDDPNGANGAHKLVEEVARIAGIGFSRPTYKSTYLNTLQRFIQVHQVDLASRPTDGLVVHDIIPDPVYLQIDTAGPYTDPFLDPDPGAPDPDDPPEPLDPLIAVQVKNPTFDDLRRELGRSQDVLLWLSPLSGTGMSHLVTAEGWEKKPDGSFKIFISDPWTPVPAGPGPDNNTDPNRASHDMYDVLGTDPFLIDYGNQKWVKDMIFVSPMPEPATLGLLLIGGLLMLKRKR